MSKPHHLELFIDCPVERMDELLTLMKTFTKRPWMFWDMHYNPSFSPRDPSFDFARFEIDDPNTIPNSSERTAKYLGQIRWFKQRDFNVLLAWETRVGDGEVVSKSLNDFLVQDFYDQVVKPASEQLNLTVTIGVDVWQNRTNMDIGG